MTKEYSLLRPFDLEAAKAGEPICTDGGDHLAFVAEAGPDGDHVVRLEDGNLVWGRPVFLRMAPLAWVEGRPVYKGDTLWYAKYQFSIQVTGYSDGMSGVLRGVVLKENPPCVTKGETTLAPVSVWSWSPPKVKKSGWMNGYANGRPGRVWGSREKADEVAVAEGRIDCVLIEWEQSHE